MNRASRILEAIKKLNQNMNSYIIKFSTEECLHKTYQGFKMMKINLIVDPKNLLLKIENVHWNEDEMGDFVKETLYNTSRNSFNIKKL